MDMLGPAILSFTERLSSIQRLESTSIIDMGPQIVSSIERFFSIIQSILYQSFHAYTCNTCRLGIGDRDWYI